MSSVAVSSFDTLILDGGGVSEQSMSCFSPLSSFLVVGWINFPSQVLRLQSSKGQAYIDVVATASFLIC